MSLRLVALGIVDLAVLGACWAFGTSIGVSLFAHAGLSALGYVIWLRGGGRIGFAPALLGIAGPIGILVALPFGRRASVQRDDDIVFGARRTRTAHRGAELAVARMLDGRVHHAPPEMLGSLVTIMRHGDVAARRRALETVVRSFEPSLSPLIALALTDGDQTIRALAAAAAARVGQNLAVARARLEADAADPETVATLATLLADHARADVLLSDSQRTHLREDAVAMLAAERPRATPAADALHIEALWAAGDYDGIDRLVIDLEPHDGTPADWWRAASAG